MSGQISETPVLTELSELLSSSVEAADLRRARLHLLDWIGCALAGSVEPAGVIFRQQESENESQQAFAWGGLGNILEMDDVDKRALLHPGPTIVPAALAIAQAEGAEFTDLLTAIVRGYEATIRLGRAVGPAHYAMWHSTGTCGAIGAAAAGASLLRLDQARTAHALALAISQAAGLWHTRHDADSMGKQLHTAAAARDGVVSARLAQSGLKGPLGILEGEQGFFAAMCCDGDPNAVISASETGWAIHEVSFKPWPACRHAHAVIDAALDLRDRVDLDSEDPILVSSYEDALKFCDRAEPATVIEAKFSLQHSVAVALLRGQPQLKDFQPDAIADPAVAALRRRVSVEVGPDYEARYPARFGAELVAGGERSVVMDALGDPENPMSDAQIRQKAVTLMMAGGMSDAASAALCDRVLQETPSAAELVTTLQEVLA